jgi:RNA polymerase sigma-70 factor (ECF subfamily)
MASVAEALEPDVALRGGDFPRGAAPVTRAVTGAEAGTAGERTAAGAAWLEAADAQAEVTRAQVAAARRGDGEAFADLFLAHERRLRLLAFGVLRDPDLVDDALQETALRAFRALGRFRGEARVGTWLHRITVRVCLDMIDDTRRQAALAQRAEGGRPSGLLAADPQAVVDDQARLAAALAQLSPAQRAVVVVVLQLGFDLSTAATILAVPRGTVASRLYAARQVLMAALVPKEGPHA